MGCLFHSTIADLTDRIRSKKISPVEVTEAFLQRICDIDPKVNAFVHLDAEGSRKQACAAEAALTRGTPLGALHGVPVTVKSCIDVAGWPCPAGSLLRKEYVAHRDAPLVHRLKAAGAIVLGNTNTPEFLMAYETNNLLKGKTSNPWNAWRSAGGSSGGEAAAIASGCSMGGVGSDGGGSIRVPAHFCGICGLKPTPGRIPSTGHFPPGAGAICWLGVVGPMARTVADVRTLFDVMAGPDPGDALSAPLPANSGENHNLRDLRVGVLESTVLGKSTSETQATVQRAAAFLSDQGFAVESFMLSGLDRVIDLWWFFFGPVISYLFRPIVTGHEEQISPMLLEYLAHADSQADLTLDQFVAACASRDHIRAEIVRQMKDVSVLLSPVSSGPAFRHAEGSWRSGAEHSYRDMMRYSQWLNLTGLPGISVPFGVSSEGLPIGVQVIGRPYEEELILTVAERLEQARGQWQSPPL
jgi:Asp-tRNA(Asn)/Glu-tRNA(Gln) amidotransferase A subunit family amidase